MNNKLARVLFSPPVRPAKERKLPPASNTLRHNPWMVEEGVCMIVSADLDGYLKALSFRHKFGWQIVGLYDTQSLVLKPGVDIANCISVDSEMLTQTRHSFGHHFTLAGKHMLNANVEAGVIPSMDWLLNPWLSIKNIQKYFFRKFNVGGIHYLNYLFGEPMPKNELARYLLLKADSTYKQFYKYGFDPENPNTYFHLETMGNDWALEMMNNYPGPLRGPIESHPFHLELSAIVDPFMKVHGVKNPNKTDFRLSEESERRRLRNYLIGLNDVFGYRPFAHGEWDFSDFVYTQLLRCELQYSPSVVPELIDIGLWTNAITNCNHDDGIVFGVTTNFPKEYKPHWKNPFVNYPELAKHFVRQTSFLPQAYKSKAA